MVFGIKKKNLPGFLLRWGLTLAICFIIILPLWWIFISSITPASQLYKTPIDFFPAGANLDSYQKVFTQLHIWDKAKNTLIITAIALVSSILFGMMAAYAFARFPTRGLKIANMLLLFSSMIPGIVTARSAYDFLRAAHLLDTYAGLSIMYTSAILPFSVLILMNFVQQIPASIEEAAEVDGTNFIQKLFYVMLPLMMPAIATIAIINFISCLNDLFTPLFFANRIETLSIGITTVPRDNTYDVPWDLISTMGWIIIAPIIVFVLCFERQIMEGIMAGGVKQ